MMDRDEGNDLMCGLFTKAHTCAGSQDMTGTWLWKGIGLLYPVSLGLGWEFSKILLLCY